MTVVLACLCFGETSAINGLPCVFIVLRFVYRVLVMNFLEKILLQGVPQEVYWHSNAKCGLNPARNLCMFLVAVLSPPVPTGCVEMPS